MAPPRPRPSSRSCWSRASRSPPAVASPRSTPGSLREASWGARRQERAEPTPRSAAGGREGRAPLRAGFRDQVPDEDDDSDSAPEPSRAEGRPSREEGTPSGVEGSPSPAEGRPASLASPGGRSREPRLRGSSCDARATRGSAEEPGGSVASGGVSWGEPVQSTSMVESGSCACGTGQGSSIRAAVDQVRAAVDQATASDAACSARAPATKREERVHSRTSR